MNAEHIAHIADGIVRDTGPVICNITGGGIRTLSALACMAHMDDYLQKKYNRRLQDIITAYAGSSCGALVAVCMAYLDMSPAYIMKHLFCPEILERIMPTEDNAQDSWCCFKFYCTPQFDGVGKRQIINQLVPAGTMQELCKGKPRLWIPTYNLSARKPELHDSHTSTKSFREILDATSAAPGYYPPVHIGLDLHADGGLSASSADMVAMAYGGQNCRIMSIGCGRHETVKYPLERYSGIIGWFQNNLIEIFIRAPHQLQHELMRESMGDRFLRINGDYSDSVSDSLCDISRDNIRSLKAMGHRWFQVFKHDIIRFLAQPVRERFGSFSGPTST